MPAPTVIAPLRFITRESLAQARRHQPRLLDLRQPERVRLLPTEAVDCAIADARNDPALGLERSGFELLARPTAVVDWYDEAHVVEVFHRECRALAAELTGASHTFTFDHLIREPGRQIAGGGLGRAGTGVGVGAGAHSGPGGTAGTGAGSTGAVTGPERGGGYVSGVHMDYTEGATWGDYLALHGHQEPAFPARVVVLNMWRPLHHVVNDHPLAVCDGRSVAEDDLLETVVYGYGHPGYSWHDIGVAIYDVAASPRHRWYRYHQMTPDEILVMKTYDTRGVIGRACPHASFADPDADPGGPPRTSIELRVLCYIT